MEAYSEHKRQFFLLAYVQGPLKLASGAINWEKRP
jgi:hypothetical protein